MEIITTPTAEHLDLDGFRLGRHPRDGKRRFPDGEVYVQLEEVEDIDEALLVHAGMPEPNRGLAYLLGTLGLLKQHGVSTEVFFTYGPYSMQDDAFYDGSVNMAQGLLGMMVGHYGVEHIYTLDAHFSHREWVEWFPFTDIHTFPLFEEVIGMEDYVVVGPDCGAVERFGIQGFEKERSNSYTVDIDGEMDLEGQDVLVFDDVIETGGTMVEAYETVKEQGADRVEAVAVHGALPDGIEQVRQTFDATYISNSTGGHDAEVQVEPLIRDLV